MEDILVSSLMLDFQFLSSSKFIVHTGSCHANPTQGLTYAATRGVNHAIQVDKRVDHFNISICHLDC